MAIESRRGVSPISARSSAVMPVPSKTRMPGGLLPGIRRGEPVRQRSQLPANIGEQSWPTERAGQ